MATVIASRSVQPRVCGERGGSASQIASASGSAPRVRGEEDTATDALRLCRFSPACAGRGPRGGTRTPEASVQPRVCGERPRNVVPDRAAFGSAPRVRGEDPSRPSSAGGGRFSPACAGRGSSSGSPAPRSSVQPRVCGERLLEPGRILPGLGSAPRVRGEAGGRRRGPGGRRFSPACAGRGSSTATQPRRSSVQPRVCGERVGREDALREALGSAPRVRGEAPRPPRRRRRPRFSPACAGRGGRRAAVGRPTPVQPRVCGERVAGVVAFLQGYGSAPRVRGEATSRTSTSAATGFSPACAGRGSSETRRQTAGSVQPRVCGERGRSRSTRTARSVQPRVCGERGARTVSTSPTGGSAPRVRGEAGGRSWLIGLRAVQPRVCGERTPPAPARGATHGSAPRVRGEVIAALYCGNALRFSPACAGRGDDDGGHTARRAVQPRVCGERTRAARLSTRRSGSAPRVRGEGIGGIGPGAAGRFSPACAGRGAGGALRLGRPAVQPRVCGERIGAGGSLRRKCGSAPRVRGEGARRRVPREPGRFSPACAGRGGNRSLRRGRSPVQPRVCGERTPDNRRFHYHLGSAPRVRGEACKEHGEERNGRFSPACAGRGTALRSFSQSSTVQPRVCGERPYLTPSASAAVGSAPRVRGEDARGARRDRRLRFSPACAGRGPCRPVARLRVPVQPRVCGERLQERVALLDGGGSAPRVRGEDRRREHVAPVERFSPACAGRGPTP